MLRVWFKYELKDYFGNWQNVVWTVVFPFAYLTVFMLATYNIASNNYDFDPVTVAITTSGESENFETVIAELGIEGIGNEDAETDEDIYLYYTYTSAEEGEDLLENEDVFAQVFYDSEDGIEIFTLNNPDPFELTLLQNVFDSYMSQEKLYVELFEQLAASGELTGTPEQINTRIEEVIENVDAAGSQTVRDYIDLESRNEAIYPFFGMIVAAIVYVAFYPMFLGQIIIEKVAANKSSLGLRLSATPTSKVKRFLVSLVPSLVIGLMMTVTFYIYAVFILNVNIGDQHLFNLLALISTTLASIFTGTALAALISNYSFANVLGIFLPLAFGFTSGMMGVQVQNQIREFAPILDKLNPVSQASRSIYYIFGEVNFPKYFEHMTNVWIYLGIMLVITILSLRKESYESV